MKRVNLHQTSSLPQFLCGFMTLNMKYWDIQQPPDSDSESERDIFSPGPIEAPCDLFNPFTPSDQLHTVRVGWKWAHKSFTVTLSSSTDSLKVINSSTLQSSSNVSFLPARRRQNTTRCAEKLKSSFTHAGTLPRQNTHLLLMFFLLPVFSELYFCSD